MVEPRPSRKKVSQRASSGTPSLRTGHTDPLEALNVAAGTRSVRASAPAFNGLFNHVRPRPWPPGDLFVHDGNHLPPVPTPTLPLHLCPYQHDKPPNNPPGLGIHSLPVSSSNTCVLSSSPLSFIRLLSGCMIPAEALPLIHEPKRPRHRSV